MRVVLDANVFVSALVSSRGVPSRILSLWRIGAFAPLASRPILSELERVLRYPKLQQRYRLPDTEIATFLDLVEACAIHVDVKSTLLVVKADPEDNRYLECALEGGARYVISGDRHLLDLAAYRGIRILAPAEFLVVLSLDGSIGPTRDPA